MVIHHGDCLEVMAGMEPESVDAIVTDPPYDLTGHRWDSLGEQMEPGKRHSASRQRGGFMGKAWDGTGIAFRRETWEAALRVARPSSYLLAFGGTRTVHRMATAIEDAGWIIRDMLVWAYASGFPKSKASLKPAWEPIVMARKPGPLRMLAIDECRIPLTDGEGDDWREGEPANERRYSEGGNDGFAATPSRRIVTARNRALVRDTPAGMGKGLAMGGTGSPLGRWPANVILTDPIFDGGVDGVVGGGETSSGKMLPTETVSKRLIYGDGALDGYTTMETYGDSGTYSRFFLVPKADRSDREPVISTLPLRRGGAETMDPKVRDGAGESRMPMRANVHPTVKPTELMRHLVRLVTPVGGTVLDPFLGSGTTGLACELEGFPWIGIEREAEYVAIAEARLNGTQRGLGLDVPAPTSTWKDYLTATRYPVKGPSQSSWFTESARDKDDPAA